MFGDGVPFGGGGSGLPTARRPSLLERVQMWISGRRVGYEISVLDTENDARS